MKTAPNETVIHGNLIGYTPAADGYGGDVEIEVIRNDTPDPAADFIRPAAGSRVRAFYPPRDGEPLPPIGTKVAATLTLSAGPFGGRIVVRSLRPG
jgi:hypothetical protein